MRIPLLLAPILLLSGSAVHAQSYDSKGVDPGNGPVVGVVMEGRYAPSGEIPFYYYSYPYSGYPGESYWDGWGTWTGLAAGLTSQAQVAGVGVNASLLFPVQVETGDGAPVLRFSLNQKGRELSYGEHWSKSTPLVSRNNRVDGLRGYFQIGRVELELLQGETLSPIDGETDSTGWVTTWGRHRRTVSNLNLNVNPIRNWHITASVVQGQDEHGPRSQGVYRYENLAGGGEVVYWPGKVRFNASVGMSRTKTIPLSGTVFRRDETAWEAGVGTVFSGHLLVGRAYSVPRYYQSFAGLSRPIDRRGFGIWDGYRFLQKSLTVNLGYDRYRNSSGGGPVNAVSTGASFYRSLRVGPSTRISPRVSLWYSRRDAGSWQDDRYAVTVGSWGQFGKHHPMVRAKWSERNSPGYGYDRLLLEAKESFAAGKRLNLEAGVGYDVYRYDTGIRQSATRVFMSLSVAQPAKTREAKQGDSRYGAPELPEQPDESDDPAPTGSR